MKILSLKLDDEIFKETEEITNKIDQARNRYINEAVRIYNAFNKRKLLKQQLSKESKITSKESMDILHEFEKLMDENQSI
jgi:predicted transcriptional regulator